jgi:MOB kinase activator 1
MCAWDRRYPFPEQDFRAETDDDHTAHLNTSYRHFFLFINEVGSLVAAELACPDSSALTQFDLVDKKELVPLDELNEAILAEDGKNR